MKKTITRKSTISLNYSNTYKELQLKDFMFEYKRVVNLYINILWENGKFSGTFLDKELLNKIDTWLSQRAKQCAGKQALQIVKSQRKRKKKTKPLFNKDVVELDSRFIDVQEGKNSFDTWIKFSSLGNKIKILVPSKKHYHFNRFKHWNQRNSARLRLREDNKLFLDMFFEKDIEYNKGNKIIGLDCGYKKLLVDSNNNNYGEDLESKIEKISRKQQGSKAFKRALIERNEYINTELKNIDYNNLNVIVVEDLKDVKKGSKGKIRKSFNNKLQRWVYAKTLNRLEQLCELNGVHIHRTNPAYTSQECSECGDVHKSNRKGELFKCGKCGHIADADHNASLNILNRFRLQENMVPAKENKRL